MTSTTTAAVASPLAAIAAPPEVAQAMTHVTALETAAAAIVIDCPAMYQAAAEELVDVRTRWKAVEAQRVHLKEPFLEGSRRIDEFFRTPLSRLEQLGDALKARMLTFKEAEDRRAREAAEAEARRQAAEREELQRIQREAQERERQAQAQAEAARREAARKEAEAAEAARAAAAESARKLAEAQAAGDAAAAAAAEAEAQAARDAAAIEAANAQAAREAAEAEAAAVALQAQQDAEAAQASLDLADVAPPTALAPSRAVAAGISGRETWKLKAVDKRELVKSAAKALESGDDSLLAYLVVDEKALNGIARALKGAARVPGCTFGPETTIAARSR